jgi:hypothetical protein
MAYLRHFRSNHMEVDVLLLGRASIGGVDGDLILPDIVQIGGDAESLADGGEPADVARREEGEEASEAVGGKVEDGGSRRVGAGGFSCVGRAIIDGQFCHRCFFLLSSFFFFFFFLLSFFVHVCLY